MKIVYLDQNHWIELARAAHGRKSDSGALELLTELQRAAVERQACFPLSLGHFMEKFKQHAPDRRRRLAHVMWALSGGLTVADPQVVLQLEAEAALARVFPERIPYAAFRISAIFTAASS